MTRLVREVPIPQRTPIRVWLAWLAIAGVLAAMVLPCMFGSYMTRCRKPEEALQLDQIGRRAKAYFMAKGEFPIGRTQLLPPWSCCPDKCTALPSQAWAADPIWAALAFRLDEATQVHYSYESLDGKTFRATGVRDAKCDGAVTTYVLEGSIDSGGGPTVTLIRPPPRGP